MACENVFHNISQIFLEQMWIFIEDGYRTNVQKRGKEVLTLCSYIIGQLET
jgi:hypothetical protein